MIKKTNKANKAFNVERLAKALSKQQNIKDMLSNCLIYNDSLNSCEFNRQATEFIAKVKNNKINNDSLKLLSSVDRTEIAVLLLLKYASNNSGNYTVVYRFA